MPTNLTNAVTTLQTTITAPLTGAGFMIDNGLRGFEAVLTTSAGNGSATIVFEGSNDNANFLTMATVTFATGACPQADGFVSAAPWPFVRSRVTAIAGTNAQVVTTVSR